MTKPTNFSYSNTLTSTRQPLVDTKGDSNNGMSSVSAGVMGGLIRPNVNLGHNPQTSAGDNFNIAQNYIGPFARPYPMKHWRRQLSTNGQPGQNSRSSASISVVDRPGGTVFRGYTKEGDCSCDGNGNLYVTFDNKFLQSNSKSIKPAANIEVSSGTKNNKIQNNGVIQIGPVDASNSYQIQTGIYTTTTICNTPENNIIKSAVTLLSKSYYSDNRAYLKSRCKLYNQKQSFQEMDGIIYIDDKGNPIPPSNSPTGTQNYRTNNCAWPYQNGTKNACTKTIYKPSNAQFATQGAVDNGTRLAKLKYDTITKNGASFRTAFGEAAANAGKYQGGYNGSASYFLKSKYNPPLAWKRNGQKTVCANGNKNCGPGQTLSSFWSM
jgi:hypothetical protein